MGDMFFCRLQYAFFCVLYRKKVISEKELREMTAFLHKKLREGTDDGR